jgi:acyl-coenzyme A synthetase/AMP-(fatty) acid ligase
MVTPTPTPEQIHDERLVIDVIDEIAAKHPERVWGSFPVSSSDLSAGFQDVTYRSLSHAIDTAAFWLDSVLGQEDGDVFAFYGDRDFRQAILAAAAAKTGRQVGKHQKLTWSGC